MVNKRNKDFSAVKGLSHRWKIGGNSGNPYTSTNKKKKEVIHMKVKIFEIVQQVSYLDLPSVQEVLKKDVVRDYAYILHDKDIKDDGTLKAPHYHIAVRLKEAYDLKYISKWFGVEMQYVSKAKGRWNDLLLYLTHANATNKHQYPVECVISNFDFSALIKRIDTNSRKEEIVSKIVAGEIREFNFHQEISGTEYVKFKSVIEKAFQYRTAMLKGANREMNCIYINGDSGTGKTTYAKELATKKGYSIFVSSGSNDVLDGYGGEDCIILDDLRPSCMGLSDLLKMLDNNTSSTVKSRYKNKVLECKLIVITTTLEIDEFFKKVFSEQAETIVQLKRRCSIKIHAFMDFMHVSLYQSETRDYGEELIIKNPLKDKYVIKDLSPEEYRKSMMESLVFADEDIIQDI